MTRRLKHRAQVEPTDPAGATGSPSNLWRSRRRRGRLDLRKKVATESDLELATQDVLQRGADARAHIEDFYRFVIKHEITKEPLDPAPHQKVKFDFIEHHPRCVIRIPIGCGKCVTGSTRIADQRTGVPRPIAEIVADDSATMVQAWAQETGVEWAELGGKYNTGRKQCIRITTRDGRQIETTPEHPYITPMGWRPASELAVGGSIGVPAKLPGPVVRVSLTRPEIILLALFFAEGSTTTNAGFSTGDEWMLKMACDAAAAIGCDVKHRNAYDYAVTKRTGKLNPAISLLRKHGLFGCKAVDKRIPPAVFALPDEQLGLFLSVVWACDGSVERTRASITLASEGAIDDLHHLLLRCGVQAAKGYKKAKFNGAEFDSWRLNVRAGSHPEFSDCMSDLWGHKRRNMDRLLAAKHSPNVGLALVSLEFQDAFIGRVKASGVTIGAIKYELGWGSHSRARETFFGVADRGNGVRSLARGFAVAAEMTGQTDQCGWLIDGSVYWDEIASIEDIGVQEVFDLTVPGQHCFIGNDIIAHNTFGMAAVTLWLTGNDVTQRGAVVSKTQSQAAKVVSMCSDYITEPALNQPLVVAFPWLRKSPRSTDPWTINKLTVERPPAIRDPTLVAVGLDGAIGGARLSWIVADDTIDVDNSSTPEAREKARINLEGRILSRLDPRGARAVFTNTPWDREDLTYYLEEQAGWPTIQMDIYGNVRVTNADAAWMSKALDKYLRPSTLRDDTYRLKAHDPDPDEQTPLWPERMDHPEIEAERTSKMPHEFARLYLCEPFNADSARCQRDWIEKCKLRGIGTTLVHTYDGPNPVFTGLDLAIGKKGKHDKCVFFTFELLPDGSRRLLNVVSGRWSGPVIVDMTADMHVRYGGVLTVENNAAQDYIRQFADPAVNPNAKRKDIIVKAHTTLHANKISEDFGVESIFMEMRNGAWIIPCDHNGKCEPEVQKWIDEMIYYMPIKHTGDALMACWIARERARRHGHNDSKPKRGASTGWSRASAGGGF